MEAGGASTTTFLGHNMAEDSKIQWTDHTFNPWRGCTKISDGCKHCYAEAMSGRNPKVLGEWGPQGVRALASEAYWRQPLGWARAAAAAGVRRRVFCASLADVFEDRADLIPHRHRLLALIALTPELDWLLLTKRADVMRRTFADPDLYHEVLRAAAVWRDRHPALRRVEIPYPGRGWPNLWAGVSVENQAAADLRIPHLMEVPAAVRFLSVEPLLEEVDLRLHRAWSPLDMGLEDDPLAVALIRQAQDEAETGALYVRGGIHWVIVGGESGPNARPCNLSWIRGVVEQCQGAGVPVFVKQLGANSGLPLRDRKGGDPSEWPADLDVRQWPQAVSA